MILDGGSDYKWIWAFTKYCKKAESMTISYLAAFEAEQNHQSSLLIAQVFLILFGDSSYARFLASSS